MREDNDFYEGMDEQELEDAILNYGTEKKKEIPIPVLIILCLLMGGWIGVLISNKSDAQNRAAESIEEAQQVAAQTVTKEYEQADTAENINAPETTITQLYIEGYNVDLTEEVEQILTEIYPDIPLVSYSELLTEACEQGTIMSDAQTIAKEYSTAASFTIANCEMGVSYDSEMLKYGLTNNHMLQENVSAYWVGAVAENDRYVIYILFEKN